MNKVVEALNTSIVAIDDWLNTYAHDLCNEERVKEASNRIKENGGTCYYIAVTQEKNRQALPIAEAMAKFIEAFDAELKTRPKSKERLKAMHLTNLAIQKLQQLQDKP